MGRDSEAGEDSQEKRKKDESNEDEEKKGRKHKTCRFESDNNIPLSKKKQIFYEQGGDW